MRRAKREGPRTKRIKGPPLLPCPRKGLRLRVGTSAKELSRRGGTTSSLFFNEKGGACQENNGWRTELSIGAEGATRLGALTSPARLARTASARPAAPRP